jgi:predicted hydrocarbon binding protein
MEYEFDEENGIIHDKVTGDRCLILTKARMHQILLRLTDLFQSGAQVIITEASKAAGENYATKVPKQTQADAAMFLKTAVQRFTDAGLGKIEILDFNLEAAELQFRIWNNLFAEMRNEDSTTYCNVVGAFVGGMYKQITSKKPEIKEIKCIGKGDAYCEWHIKPEK